MDQEVEKIYMWHRDIKFACTSSKQHFKVMETYFKFGIDDLELESQSIKYNVHGVSVKSFPWLRARFQSQAFYTETNQSQSSIHVNIMVPGVTGIFLLKHPVAVEDS